jgi:hypothetical protein
MGFLKSLFSGSKGDEPPRYVKEKAFRENLARQTRMSPQTLAQLRTYGVNDATRLKLEFFFYTDTETKAETLAKALRGLQYQAESGASAGDEPLFLVTGWTTQMQMDDNTVVLWTQRMCQLGYDHDCEFDGWGTHPNQ